MDTSFVNRLFDFSFNTFITTSIIKILYILALIGAALYTLVIFVAFATQGIAGILFGLILAPIVFAIAVIFARVYMELLIVLFRIERHTDVIARAASRE